MTLTRFLVCAAAAFLSALLLACGPQPGPANVANNATNNSGPGTGFTRPAPPDKATLVGLERAAFDAWKNRDADFFEGFLADNFTLMTPAGPLDKPAAVKEISEHKCEVAGYSFSDELVTPAGIDAVILTMKVSIDGTCEGRKLPSPGWSISVFVRDVDKWKGVYHNEVAVTDLDGRAGTVTTAPSPPGAGSDTRPGDAMIQALLAAETKSWEAWKSRDANLLQQGLMQDLVYIDARGSGRYKRDEAIRLWTDPGCSVKSFSLSNERSRQISANAALLTYKGTAVGSCGGKPVLPVWGSTLYMKEGAFWKALMVVQLPA